MVPATFVGDVAEVRRRGSVVRSWLLDLTAAVMRRDPGPGAFGSGTSDSGEGRWTVQAAIDEGTSTNVISAALHEWFASRGNADFAGMVQQGHRSALTYVRGDYREQDTFQRVACCDAWRAAAVAVPGRAAQPD